MLLIDCFVLSAKGAGYDSPAQRAGCAGHLVSSAESAKWFIASKKTSPWRVGRQTDAAPSALPQTYGNSDPGRRPGLLHPAPAALCSNRTSSGANLMHQVCYRHFKGCRALTKFTGLEPRC